MARTSLERSLPRTATVSAFAVSPGGRGGHSGVRVISCQMFTENRNDNGDEIVALKYGADAGAVISQNSWGYTNVYEMPEITKDAIDYFIEYAGLDENGVQVGPMRAAS